MKAWTNERRVPAWGLVLALVASVFALYGQVAKHDFLTYDDGSYLTENPNVRQGLSFEAVRWAFTEFHSANWHPLTWISHQLDVTLFGLAPGPHHLVSVGFHALNAVLCFLFLRRTTRSPWAAFLVALLFAVHPLRVESVAWASERKDVLSGTFFFLTLLAYERMVRAPGPRRMAWVALAFALGLLAKPMLVTVPVVLWLIDFWPLGRGRRSTPDTDSLAPKPAAPAPALARSGKTRGAGGHFGWWLEKVPLLGLAVASAVVTLVAQHAGGALRSVEVLSLGERLGTALIGTATYLRQTFWPADLAFFYPHPAFVATETFSLASLPVLASTLALGLVTAAALALRRRAPVVLLGWCWMLVMLLPVLGLVQVGAQLHADRYAYLPTLGLLFALVYGARELLPSWRRPLFGLGLLAAALLAAVAWKQVATWRNIRTLCAHALAVTRNNYVALEHLGVAEQRAGNLEAARAAYEATLALAPALHDAHSNLGAVFLALDQPGRAIECFQASLRIQPGFLEAQLNWGLLEEQRGDNAAALEHFARAAAQHPDSGSAWRKVGDAAMALGEIDRAAKSYSRAYELDRALDALAGLSWARLEQGRWSEAQEDLQRVLAIDPDHAAATHLLAYLEASARAPELRGPAAARARLTRCAARGEAETWWHKRAEAALLAAEGDYPAAIRMAAESSAGAPRFAWGLLRTEREIYQAGRALERP